MWRVMQRRGGPVCPARGLRDHLKDRSCGSLGRGDSGQTQAEHVVSANSPAGRTPPHGHAHETNRSCANCPRCQHRALGGRARGHTAGMAPTAAPGIPGRGSLGGSSVWPGRPHSTLLAAQTDMERDPVHA